MLAIDFQQSFQEAWDNVITFVPKFVGFLLILVVGYFVAKLVERALDRVLERAGFDGWMERGVLKSTFERSPYDASDIISKLTFWALFLIVLQLAFGVFGPNPISDLLEGIVAYLPNVIVAVVIIVIASAIARVVVELTEAMLSAVPGGGWIAKGAGATVLVIGIFAALNQLKIAPEIVNGLFFGLVAIVAGSAIVAIGGGGIRTMQRYWDRVSGRLEERPAEASPPGMGPDTGQGN